ncbi:hypothetical protein RND81_04G197500 [Saponaria officinalis]|uniref:NADP-dependent oxidoreductase domain-containing protein n=2 Tax=Saponaria officinalis TaxID=3572 RepID=A0AAW1LQW1_SAPOF
MATHEVPRVNLGSQGFQVSKLGLGCCGLTIPADNPKAEETGIAIIKDAFSKGVTFFDTSDIYGNHTNEVIVGKAVKQLPREQVQIATKFGIMSLRPQLIVKGNPEYVRSSCEASLKRLDVDYIDLYYQHVVDTSTPIEATMGELKKLVEEGKIKYIGLSEASPDTIRRAHAVHPVTAVQIEWSLWTRDVEDNVVPLCRELGIGIVAHTPLGRGLSAGKGVVEPLPYTSVVAMTPRFQAENMEKNKEIYYRLEKTAAKHGCTPAQLALSWILHQGHDIVPIPGTTKIKNLDTNIGSLKVKLTEEEVKEVSDAVPQSEVAGDRMCEAFIGSTWKFANTPPI